MSICFKICFGCIFICVYTSNFDHNFLDKNVFHNYGRKTRANFLTRSLSLISNFLQPRKYNYLTFLTQLSIYCFMYLPLVVFLSVFFGIYFFCPFKFCNHLDEEKRAGSFALIVFLVFLTVAVLWLFLAVPWVGLKCVIVVFSRVFG